MIKVIVACIYLSGSSRLGKVLWKIKFDESASRKRKKVLLDATRGCCESRVDDYCCKTEDKEGMCHFHDEGLRDSTTMMKD